MNLLNKITLHFKKVKNKRIEFIVKQLIDELEIHYKNKDVQYISIWFDYDHIKKRDIRIEYNGFNLKIDTNKLNKNFKKQ